MSDPSSRRTPLSVTILQQILDSKGWSQYELADRARLHRSTVSMQVASPWRPIRDQHLTNYLRALDRTERKLLLAAWLRDVLGPDVLNEIVDPATNRVHEEIVAWAPKVADSDKKMLAWLSNEMMNDPELADMIRSVCRRLGFSAA